MNSNNSSHVPLTDILPVSFTNSSSARKVMVYDTIDSDGRFLLHALTAAATNTTPIYWWLGGGAWTEALIRQALQKMSSGGRTTNTAGSFAAKGVGGISSKKLPLRASNNNNLTVSSMAERILQKIEETGADSDDNTLFDEEDLVRNMFETIRDWTIAQSNSNSNTICWIILDDVSAMAAVVGEQLSYRFVTSVCALAESSSVGVLVRATLQQQDSSSGETSSSSISGGGVEGVRNDEWFASGRHSTTTTSAWVSALAELADGIIDVAPLATGQTRQAHGRLFFTAASDRGWGDYDRRPSTVVASGAAATARTTNLPVNYCLLDNKVSAIRIRTA